MVVMTSSRSNSIRKLDANTAHKILKLVTQDKFHKLESFLATHSIHPDSVLNPRRGQTGLHLACQLGHVDCINVFLQFGACKFSQDLKGNTGLHYASKFCMKRSIQGRPYDIKHLIVQPFLQHNPELAQVPNANGTTPQLFIDALNNFNQSSSDDETSSENAK